MKKLIFALLMFAAPSFAVENSTVEIDQGPFWIRSWQLNDQKQTASLKTVTGYESSLLLTFSGADFTYLNQQAASSFKKTGNNTYEWLYSDDKVTYKRTYDVQENVVNVSVFVQFKQKAPESAFLNVVSLAMKDDPEERYREVYYFTDKKINRELVSADVDPTQVGTPTQWVGAGSHYYVFAAIPETIPQKVLMEKTAAQNVQMSMQFPVTNNQVSLKFKTVFAPKHLDLLRSIEPSLDTTVNLGFFAFLAYPILWTLKFIYKYVHNYGVAIIILTILIKILTFPLVLKSMKGMKKMAEFQPKMKALQEKYKDDKARFNQEMMLMMRQSGYNPLAGCFPMLLQMPIFFALYSALDTAVELNHAPFAFWIHDLSAKDPYFITPVLMSLVMYFQQMLTPPSPGMDPAQQKMMRFMPLIFGAFMLTTPAGLCVYMLVNSIVSVIQQQYLNKKLGVGNAGMVAGF